MTIRFPVLMTVLTGIAISTCAASISYAQAKTSPAYYVSEFKVTDPNGIKPYIEQVDATIAAFGGRYVVRGGTLVPLEGETTTRIVVIAFDSMEKAQAWYNSPEYRNIRPIRLKSANARTYIVEGIPQ